MSFGNRRYDPFGRLGQDIRQPDPEIDDIKNPFELSDSVGANGKNNRRDVAKVETMLGQAGTLDLKKTNGPTGYWGMRTDEATRNFQKKTAETVDAQINRNGPTHRALVERAQKRDVRDAAKRRKERRENRENQGPNDEGNPYLDRLRDAKQSQMEDRARQKAAEQLTGEDRRKRELQERNKPPNHSRPFRGGGAGGGFGNWVNPKMPDHMRRTRPFLDDWLK